MAAAPCEPDQTGMPAVRQAVAVHAPRTIKKTGATMQFQRLFITSFTGAEADSGGENDSGDEWRADSRVDPRRF